MGSPCVIFYFGTSSYTIFFFKIYILLILVQLMSQSNVVSVTPTPIPQVNLKLATPRSQVSSLETAQQGNRLASFPTAEKKGELFNFLLVTGA